MPTFAFLFHRSKRKNGADRALKQAKSGLRWREDLRFDLRLELALRVGAVAKRLVAAVAATAKRDGRPSRKVVLPALGIADLELTFDSNRTIVLDSNFC